MKTKIIQRTYETTDNLHTGVDTKVIFHQKTRRRGAWNKPQLMTHALKGQCDYRRCKGACCKRLRLFVPVVVSGLKIIEVVK